MSDSQTPADLESTAILIDRARVGERAARERLARRYLPYLRVFARGRLPAGARSLEETDDVVQVAMMRGFANLPTFQAERRGSFLVYLRVIVDNLIRDRWRSSARRPAAVELPDELPDRGRTPVDHLLAGEERDRFEQAIQLLKPEQRDAIVLRFELDMSYEEIAEELGVKSANAARMRVERGLLKLTELLEKREKPS
jgi:RNA polymerase sigma-70 factor (ECF subfamily)